MAQLNGKTKGAIIGAAIVVSAASAPVWSGFSETPTVTQAQTCHGTVFAGRAGSIPNCTWNDPGSRAARQVVGRTFTGCAVGWLSKGGPWGCLYGGLGGALSVIPWG